MRLIIGITVLIAAAVVVGYAKSKKATRDESPEARKGNPYSDLRIAVLNLKGPEIGLKENSPEIIACLMETGYEDGSATLVMVADGTVSLYTSNGGGTIGAGEHEKIRDEAKTFLKLALAKVAEMQPVTSYPVPINGHTTFYFKKSGKIYSHTEKEDDLGNNRSTFSKIFLQGHAVISGIQEMEADAHEK